MSEGKDEVQIKRHKKSTRTEDFGRNQEEERSVVAGKGKD